MGLALGAEIISLQVSPLFETASTLCLGILTLLQKKKKNEQETQESLVLLLDNSAVVILLTMIYGRMVAILGCNFELGFLLLAFADTDSPVRSRHTLHNTRGSLVIRQPIKSHLVFHGTEHEFVHESIAVEVGFKSSRRELKL